jgi:predicted anti-sigma-YlaC factor YlaD
MTPSQVAASDDMGTFQALSYGEKWRVNRLVSKGESPQDPRMAIAAVELAEKCQRRRSEVPLHRGLAIALILVGLAFAALAATQGDALMVGAMALLVLSNVAQFAFNPMTRPKNVTRSLEASKRVSAAAG